MMNEKKTSKLSLKQSIDDLRNMLKSFVAKAIPHLSIIYLIVMLSGITTTFYIASQTINQANSASNDDDQTKNVYFVQFDQSTIGKLKSLNKDSNAVALPKGRINPFSESQY